MNTMENTLGITKLDKTTASLLKDEIEILVNDEGYDQWYEDALVQMIFDSDF